MAKRNRFEGVYRTSSGAWRYVVELPHDPETGQRRQKSISVDANGERFATAKAAHDERVLHLARMAAPEPSEAARDPQSVAAYLEVWLARLTVRDATRWVYRRHIDHYIVPSVGSIALAELHQSHIAAWLHELGQRPSKRTPKGADPQPLSPTTISKAHAILSQALTAAVAMDLVPRNVVALVRPPGPARIEPNTWDAEQTAAFLDATLDRPYGPLYRLLLFTGMRIGEAVALRWDDIDLERGTVAIRRTMTRDQSGRRIVGDAPKTPSSRRTIAIPAGVVTALRRQHDSQTWERRRAGHRWQDGGYVFTGWDGRPLDPDRVRPALLADCTLAEVPPLRIHDLRHTAATLMVASGERLEVISDRLGHRSIATTSDLYVHPSLEQDRQVAERFESFIESFIERHG